MYVHVHNGTTVHAHLQNLNSETLWDHPSVKIRPLEISHYMVFLLFGCYSFPASLLQILFKHQNYYGHRDHILWDCSCIIVQCMTIVHGPKKDFMNRSIIYMNKKGWDKESESTHNSLVKPPKFLWVFPYLHPSTGQTLCIYVTVLYYAP